MNQPPLAMTDLAGLLDHLVARLPGAETAVLLTADAQTMVSWGGAYPQTTEEISQVASTLRSLAEAAGRQLRLQPTWRTVVALDNRMFALASAGPNAILGVTLNGMAAVGPVLDDTAAAADQAGRMLAAQGTTSDTAVWPLPTRRQGVPPATVPCAPRHPARGTAQVLPRAPLRSAGRRPGAEISAASVILRDPGLPSDDQLERVLTRLRAL